MGSCLTNENGGSRYSDARERANVLFTHLRGDVFIHPPTSVQIIGGEARIGDNVLLRPSARADAFDMMLAGKTANIVAIQQDYENRIYVVVTIDDDPGRIQDDERVMPGHRFFFFADEVELLKEIEIPWRRE